MSSPRDHTNKINGDGFIENQESSLLDSFLTAIFPSEKTADKLPDLSKNSSSQNDFDDKEEPRSVDNVHSEKYLDQIIINKQSLQMLINFVTQRQQDKASSNKIEEQLICGYCSLRFYLKTDLIQHLKQHSCKVLQCGFCSQKLTDKQSLHEHIILKHRLKEKILDCAVCNMHFNCITALRKHETQHSDQKSYICVWCGLCFYGAQHLIKHLKLSHSCRKTSFSCSACNETFYNKDTFKLHLGMKHKSQSSELVQTFETPNLLFKDNFVQYNFRCNTCQIGFNRKSDVLTHISSVHKEGLDSDINGKLTNNEVETNSEIDIDKALGCSGISNTPMLPSESSAVENLPDGNKENPDLDNILEKLNFAIPDNEIFSSSDNFSANAKTMDADVDFEVVDKCEKVCEDELSVESDNLMVSLQQDNIDNHVPGLDFEPNEEEYLCLMDDFQPTDDLVSIVAVHDDEDRQNVMLSTEPVVHTEGHNAFELFDDLNKELCFESPAKAEPIALTTVCSDAGKEVARNGTPEKEEPPESNNFRCLSCYKMFSRQYNLQQHVRLVHPATSESFKCQFCHKHIIGEQRFRNHNKRHLRLERFKSDGNMSEIKKPSINDRLDNRPTDDATFMPVNDQNDARKFATSWLNKRKNKYCVSTGVSLNEEKVTKRLNHIETIVEGMKKRKKTKSLNLATRECRVVIERLPMHEI